MRYIYILIILSNSLLIANINISVSILPQQSLIKEIGGRFVNVNLIVQKGGSPHSYEPKPSQLKSLYSSQIYFTIGVEFEDIWVPRFKKSNKHLKFIALNENANKNENRHIWLDPKNILIIGKKIYQTLVKFDKKHKRYYTKRYKKFLKKVKKTNRIIKKNIKSIKNRIFITNHKAFDHFANAYNLKQISLENSNGQIKSKQIAKIIKVIKQNHLTYIIVSPNSYNKNANIIAKENNMKTVLISPLEYDWARVLIKLSKIVGR